MHQNVIRLMETILLHLLLAAAFGAMLLVIGPLN